MRRWLKPVVSLLLMLALAGVAVDGQRSRATRPKPRPQAAAPPVNLASAAAPAAREPGALSPRNANYLIEAQLDVQKRLITGREWLTWRNTTASPTSELRYHLYYNAWRNTASTWLRERSLAGRLGRPRLLARRDWGWTDVTDDPAGRPRRRAAD